MGIKSKFSPYSRGWSYQSCGSQYMRRIFPVFAGMVPGHVVVKDTLLHFPRIRGDDPSGNSTEKCIDGDIAAL